MLKRTFGPVLWVWLLEIGRCAAESVSMGERRNLHGTYACNACRCRDHSQALSIAHRSGDAQSPRLDDRRVLACNRRGVFCRGREPWRPAQRVAASGAYLLGNGGGRSEEHTSELQSLRHLV